MSLTGSNLYKLIHTQNFFASIERNIMAVREILEILTNGTKWNIGNTILHEGTKERRIRKELQLRL